MHDGRADHERLAPIVEQGPVGAGEPQREREPQHTVADATAAHSASCRRGVDRARIAHPPFVSVRFAAGDGDEVAGRIDDPTTEWGVRVRREEDIAPATVPPPHLDRMRGYVASFATCGPNRCQREGRIHREWAGHGTTERYIVEYRYRFFGGGTMSGSFPAGGFGPGMTADGIWQAMEQLRSTFEKRVGTRMGRGDVRAAVLALLAEKPMHGYQIIREIEERSGGSWKPSAGSVYPTLQLLADEGLLTAEESNGRKTYALTEAGRAEAEEAGAAPWEAAGPGSGGSGDAFGALPKAGIELAQAAAQVRRTGTPEQIQQATTVLDEARRRLYSILAQD
ncbi:hypothetical protein LLS1_28430 [Leifsonia sp. LS1]|nr:hypothetical protein LLS1_28430 [Leifsonia sp. LS1]